MSGAYKGTASAEVREHLDDLERDLNDAREERDDARRALLRVRQALDNVTRCQAPTLAQRIKDSFLHNRLVHETIVFDLEKREHSLRAQITYWVGMCSALAHERNTAREAARLYFIGFCVTLAAFTAAACWIIKGALT